MNYRLIIQRLKELRNDLKVAKDRWDPDLVEEVVEDLAELIEDIEEAR